MWKINFPRTDLDSLALLTNSQVLSLAGPQIVRYRKRLDWLLLLILHVAPFSPISKTLLSLFCTLSVSSASPRPMHTLLA